MGRASERIQQRKIAKNTLSDLMRQSQHVVVIHYSCESFYDRPNGTSPRITSIAARNLQSAQTSSFSIHQIAERNGFSIDQIDQHYDRLEKLMLDEFYEYVRSHATYKWLHWNMRDINYGFQAIAHRYRVLEGDPVEIPEANLVDLARLIAAIYSVRYIGHPRLQKLVEKNNITTKDFLSGEDEAQAFTKREYVKLHLSTLRKVDILASIAERTDNGSIKTDATLKDIYGSYPEAIGDFLKEHWVISIIAFISALASIAALFLPH
jgi:hypothetical protein